MHRDGEKFVDIWIACRLHERLQSFVDGMHVDLRSRRWKDSSGTVSSFLLWAEACSIYFPRTSAVRWGLRYDSDAMLLRIFPCHGLCAGQFLYHTGDERSRSHRADLRA